jgi:hypothetical protein
VPDERLQILTTLSKSAKTIPAVVEFVDIAGLVKGAAEGEGLGNQFLSHIRETDAIAQVVRIFDGDVIHVSGEVRPVKDIEVVNLELVLADLQSVSKRLANLGKDAKRGVKEAMPTGRQALAELAVCEKAERTLAAGKFASSLEFSPEERIVLKSLNLLTLKPILYVLNKAGKGALDELKDGRFEELIGFLKQMHASWVIVDAALEGELNAFEAAERAELTKDFSERGIDGIDKLIVAGYKVLDLITFFTTGEDESRAWTIRRGSSAPEAGAAIHSDFHEKFIRAEVIGCDTLIADGSLAHARSLGHARTEGKQYIVQDGDVIEFKI